MYNIRRTTTHPQHTWHCLLQASHSKMIAVTKINTAAKAHCGSYTWGAYDHHTSHSLRHTAIHLPPLLPSKTTQGATHHTKTSVGPGNSSAVHSGNARSMAKLGPANQSPASVRDHAQPHWQLACIGKKDMAKPNRGAPKRLHRCEAALNQAAAMQQHQLSAAPAGATAPPTPGRWPPRPPRPARPRQTRRAPRAPPPPAAPAAGRACPGR